MEDADNSSSGVSSDQDIPTGPSDISDKISHEHTTQAALPQLKAQRQQTGIVGFTLFDLDQFCICRLTRRIVHSVV